MCYPECPDGGGGGGDQGGGIDLGPLGIPVGIGVGIVLAAANGLLPCIFSCGGGGEAPSSDDNNVTDGVSTLGSGGGANWVEINGTGPEWHVAASGPNYQQQFQRFHGNVSKNYLRRQAEFAAISAPVTGAAVGVAASFATICAASGPCAGLLATVASYTATASSPSESEFAAPVPWGGGGSASTRGGLLAGSGPVPGVIEVHPRVKSVTAFRNYRPPGGGMEFVFNPRSSRFAVGKPAPYARVGGLSPHQRLASAIDADGATVVGGMFARGPGGEILINEFSGHYWQHWTPKVRHQLTQFLERMTGQRVILNPGM